MIWGSRIDFFLFQAEDGIRDRNVTGVQTCALPIWGFHVRMIVRGAYPGAIFDEELAGMIVDEAKRQGVLLHTNENTLALKGKGTVEAVVTDQGSYETDLVLLATGLKANTEIAEKAKLSLGVNKGILVNEHLETSVKDIYAAGDCA